MFFGEIHMHNSCSHFSKFWLYLIVFMAHCEILFWAGCWPCVHSWCQSGCAKPFCVFLQHSLILNGINYQRSPQTSLYMYISTTANLHRGNYKLQNSIKSHHSASSCNISCLNWRNPFLCPAAPNRTLPTLEMRPFQLAKMQKNMQF